MSQDVQFVGDIVSEPEDLHMSDADSNEFGPSVLKDKSVRTGSSVEKESSRLQGRNGDDVSNVIVRDIHSEFSGFFGKTSGVSIDEFLDGTYNDETGGTLTIQWSANKKSAVCCKETILATGIRQVTEIAYNPSQLELDHNYPDFDDDRLQSASSVESVTKLQAERSKKAQRRLPIPDIGIEEFEPEKESPEIEF